MNADTDKLRQVHILLRRYDISLAQPEDLLVLQHYQIVIIVDDSTSMRWPVSSEGRAKLGIPSTCSIEAKDEGTGVMSHILAASNSGNKPFKSRWDELQQSLALIVEMSNVFTPSGVDVWFLNRPAVFSITSPWAESLQQALQDRPSGSTPLADVLQQVVGRSGSPRPVLLFVMTDGEPDVGKDLFLRALRDILEKRSTPYTFKVQIMACTADQDVVIWLNGLDKEFDAVDVTEDYYAELTQVLKARKCAKFTRGDWCMKAMLGAICPKFDAWDEGSQPLTSYQAQRNKAAECDMHDTAPFGLEPVPERPMDHRPDMESSVACPLACGGCSRNLGAHSSCVAS